MTKIDKVTKALKTKPLTAAQIQARFNVPNVSAVIYDLRRKGYLVFTEHTKSGKLAYMAYK